MANKPGTSPQPPARPMTRRARAKWQRERDLQRRTILFVGATIALATLIVLFGLGVSQIWIPSRPVAVVNGTTLTRSAYWELRRAEIAQQIVQDQQFLAILGGQQFGSQYQSQTPALESQVAQLRREDVVETTVRAWEDRTIIAQGAQTAYGLVVSDGEIAQDVVASLGAFFLPPPALPPTTEVTPTADLAATAPVTTTTTAAATGAPTATATPGGPTPTAAPSPSPEPTPTLPPTPLPAEASAQLETIVDEVFARYTAAIEASGQRPRLSRDDFRRGLLDQYRERLLRERIQTRLVEETSFTPDQSIWQYGVRHILIGLPEDAQPEQLEQLYQTTLVTATDVLQQLRNGADFAELARQYSTDPGSKDNGGDLGLLNADGTTPSGSSFVPEFTQAVLALEGDAISEPVRTQFGWHLIQVTSRDPRPVAEQLQQARSEAFDTWLEQQRAGAAIQRFPPPTPTPTLPPTSPPVLTPTP